MATSRTVVAAVIVIILIIIIAAVFLSYFGNNLIGKGGGPSTTQTSTTTNSTSTTSSPIVQNTTTTSSTTHNTTSTSTSTTSNTTTTNSTKNYALQLVNSGPAQLLSSPMNSSLSKTIIKGDGPCCSGPPDFNNEVNYTDNGNLWVLQGDISPGTAYAEANGSGLTLSFKTCANSANLTDCTPIHEFQRDHEAYNDPSIYGDLGAIPVLPPGSPSVSFPGRGLSLASSSPASAPLTTISPDATVFSISVNLQVQNFAGCQLDNGNGGLGCTYELAPVDSVSFGYDVGGNYDVVSIAEICTDSACSSTMMQMSAYTSNGGSSIASTLATVNSNSTFTPTHRLTIATDGKSYIFFYVDNYLLYHSNTIPIEQKSQGGGGALEFAMRTSVNNITEVATFSNVTAYRSPFVSITGLSSGMTATINGTNGFNQTLTASSNGTVNFNVIQSPTNLVVSVKMDGKIIATYTQNLQIGAVLKLAS